MEQHIKTTTIKPSVQSEAAFLKQLCNVAKESGYCFALWRLPNETSTTAILSFAGEAFELQTPFEELPAGFLFHPFDTRKNGVFLKADLMFRFANGELKMDDTQLASKSITWYEENAEKKHFQDSQPSEKHFTPSTSKNQNDFEQLINTCLEHIQQGDFEKIVPSRSKTIPLSDNFDPIEAFQKLTLAYSNALISLVYTPEHGSWLGATPEVLVSIEDKATFKTVALAGTQSYIPGVNLRNVTWTQKEIEEQALVGRYIINCFKKIRLREFEEHGPKTIVAGNLMHLKTDFSVDMKATNFPQLGSVMLRLLHPTSAVCGMPMEKSAEFLLQEEGYDRSFYSGFLGPINFNDKSHLFVNLRCMKLLHNQAICYAGAGVTMDSIPQQEWEETEIKMNTLLEVIA